MTYTLGSDPELLEDLRQLNPVMAPLLKARIPCKCVRCLRHCVVEQLPPEPTLIICMWCAGGPDARDNLDAALAAARERAAARTMES